MLRVEPDRIPEGSSFYFDEKGELIVRRDALPPLAPNVHVVDGHTIVAHLTGEDGKAELVEHSGLGWTESEKFSRNGNRLHLVAAYTLGLVWDRGEERHLPAKARRIAECEIVDEDLLIVQTQRRSWASGVRVVPGRQPLEPLENEGTYNPAAIITPDGTLVSWGFEGHQMRSTVDKVIANRLASTPSEHLELERQLGKQSLATMIGQSQPVTMYLRHFRDVFSDDYFPAGTK